MVREIGQWLGTQQQGDLPGTRPWTIFEEGEGPTRQ